MMPGQDCTEDHEPRAETPAPDPSVAHPVDEQVEGAAFGWITATQADTIRAHTAKCQACRSVLENDLDIRERLSLLRTEERRVDVLEQVMRRVHQESEPVQGAIESD